ncbi:hypothetical protein ABI59_16170 [Acidobacteria bacterium Mor1]|nr:hypothetical protein ABI59_16170 [Acidobacteria bacterium Mor1]
METEAIQVLVVDDNEAFLDAVCAWIAEQPGLALRGTARNGADAVEAAERLRPDLVLMDAFMPDMDGFEATRQVKAVSGAPRIVMVSLYDDDAVRQQSRAVGADGFVPKTVLTERLPELLGLLDESAG